METFDNVAITEYSQKRTWLPTKKHSIHNTGNLVT
jgi:hypothetical protein